MSMDKKFEDSLIEKAKTDPDAFGKLFDIHYRSILSYAISRTGSVENGHDIAAEVFFKALKNIQKYKITDKPFSAWLYKIASNETADYYRKKKYEPASFDDYLESKGIVPPSLRADLRQEILEKQKEIEKSELLMRSIKAVNSLPSVYREIISLRYAMEKSIAEISKITGKKEGTVKSILSRGMAMMKKIMQPYSARNVINHGNEKKRKSEENGE